MDLEREINVAVQLMFKHAKAVVSRNITNAVRRGDITIDPARLPGLDLLIGHSIDDSYKQSARELENVVKRYAKSNG